MSQRACHFQMLEAGKLFSVARLWKRKDPQVSSCPVIEQGTSMVGKEKLLWKYRKLIETFLGCQVDNPGESHRERESFWGTTWEQ